MILPDGLLRSLEKCEGFDRDDFVDAHAEPPVVSIRLNHAKLSHHLGPDELLSPVDGGVYDQLEIKDNVPWTASGHYLKTRPSFTLDPLFHAGMYYVQEASSMFIEHILDSQLKDKKNLKALDLCASPGGKTTLLASMPHFKLILANEIIQSRVAPLFENVIKWGAPHVFISNNDPHDFASMGEFFDVVLVDAPCSGSGLFRKEQHAVDIWNQDLVQFCSLRQKRILEDAISVIVEGGYLLYSTCSYSYEENEMNLDYIVQNYDLEPVHVEIPSSWGVVTCQSPVHKAFGYRFYPDKVSGEGFFCALFKKNTSLRSIAAIRPTKSKHSYVFTNENWIENSASLHFLMYREDLMAMHSDLTDDINLLQQFFLLKRSGMKLGSLVRGDLNPDHELAMSLLLSSQIQRHELTYDQAISFLRKDSLDISFSEKGWVLTSYKGIPLGWLKAIQGRSNNYYPKNWRITLRV